MTVDTDTIRVLHVSDTSNISAKSIERENHRMTVLTATSAEEGLGRLAAHDIDCIVSADELPDQTGIEFLKAVREESPNFPFILYTGKHSEEVASEAISAGVTDYFRTDGTEQYTVLANRITNAVDHYRSQQALAESNRDLRSHDRWREYEQELEQRSALLSSLFETLPVGVLAEDESRSVLAVNEQMFELFDMPGTPDTAIGMNCERIAEEVCEMFVDPDEFVERIGDLIAEQEPVYEEELRLTDGRTFARSYKPISLPDGMGNLWTYRDITDRKELEYQLKTLNEKTQELMRAETRTQIAEIGVETAHKVLGLDANAIHLYEEDCSGLVPVAVSDDIYDLVGEPPTFTGGDSIAWRVYESGETGAIDDVQTDPDIYNPETSIQSELYLPLGEHGILLAGSEAIRAFDQQDVVLGEILAGNIASALTQAERTEQIRDHKQELERKNERLEEFTSIVSHDLRNPLTVALGRIEHVRSQRNDDHLEVAQRALERIDSIIEETLLLARRGRRIDAVEPVSLPAVVEQCWQNVATMEATLLLTFEDDYVISADKERLAHLFENLFTNAVEHGGEAVTITVGGMDDGFYIADDGPGIPEEERANVFTAGYSTSETGTGFGLSIVKQVADAHGWEIRITESSDEGARFDITGVEAAE